MMTGDYTKVPLRTGDRWTGARMQQGRVLLDHEWNLNLDAGARAARAAAADIIGAAGVVEGAPDFEVGVTPSGTLDVTVHAGRMWVDGLMAHAPGDVSYNAQDQIAPLPTSGNALVYLEVFEEHVQPAEDASLVDPALAPVDSAARTRIGYRVRVAATTATTCKDAWDGLTRVAGSTGALTIARTAPSGPTDACAPPGDPLGQLPDGLFRVEVLDGGTAAGNTRFAWSFENGGVAVAVAPGGIAGKQVTLVPSASVKFANDDLVEVSWLARRADRIAHGTLYKISGSPETGAGGDVLTLDRAVTAPAGAKGLAVRRWDGEVFGAASAKPAAFHSIDLGVTFIAAAGSYVVGDWWGARLREEESPGVESRTNAAPDGNPHVFAPLALVDLTARKVLHDCRPTFVPLTELKLDAGSCTVSVRPGDDLQAAVDSLPAGGGELCMAAGVYALAAPLLLKGRKRIVITGAGPATIVRAEKTEAAIVLDRCDEIEIRHIRVEGGSPGGAGDAHLNGALTATGSVGVTISDCSLSCPAASESREQTCITVRADAKRVPESIRIERNALEIGPWQTGILVLDAASAVVAGNRLALPDGLTALAPGVADDLVARILRKLVAGAIRKTAETGTKPVQIPGGGTVNVVTANNASKLVDAFIPLLTAGQVSRRGPAKALEGAAARALVPETFAKLPQQATAMIDLVRQQMLAAGQGIVVGGTHVGTIQILENTVADTIQGIHVGVSDPKLGGPEAIEHVMIARNVVHALVPQYYDRDRHAIFVGNAGTVHVLDTVATITRRGGKLILSPTAVEGIRVHGQLGPFVCVRQSYLDGFTVGVRVAPVGAPPDRRMWLVAETLCDHSTKALDAPASVDRERNVP
jgi:hypothetical protein